MGKRGHGEGSIYKREDGRWVAVLDFGIVKGKRRRKSIYGNTRKEVADQLKTALHEQQQGILVVNDRQTIEQFLTHWLEESVKTKRRNRTYTSYKQVARLYIFPDLGQIQLAKLTPQQVQHFVNERLQSGLSSRTVRYAHAVLRCALNQALRWGLIARNVASLVDLPKRRKKEQDFLSPEDARKLLAVIRGDRLEALYSVALAIGLRKSEALGLLWHDIDFEQCVMRVRRSLEWIEGKPHLSELKSDTSSRTIALPDFAVVALQNHHRRQQEEQAILGTHWKNTLGLVFTTREGKPFHDIHISRFFHQLLMKAGLRHIRFYDLRHTCASLLIAQGMHARLIMDILGHSDITLTMNTYGHIMQTSRDEAAKSMNDLMQPPPIEP